MLGATQLSDPLTPQPLDCIGNDGWVLMLPRSHNEPAGFPEYCFVPSVTGKVRIELGAPPCGVRLRSNCMHGTAMPETTVHEDSDPGPSQSDVRSSREVPHVDSVPEPSTVQLASECQLRSGPFSAEARHEATHRRARCLGPLGARGLGSHR
jgi:hypothetical protein